MPGEQVAAVDPDIGYIHRCEEQLCQQGTYRHQIMPYPDRWDWGGAGLLNEWAYARTAEALADIDVPEYAQVVRTPRGYCPNSNSLMASRQRSGMGWGSPAARS